MTATRTVPFGRPWITEEEKEAVLRVLSGDVLTHGPENKAFEKEFAAFAGGGEAVAVSSGMAALHLSYWQLGLKAGDEVLVPAMTHVATVHAVEAVGARPVFVDCDPATGNVTAAGLEAKTTSLTRGLGLVHYAGIPADMEAIAAFAAKRGLSVVEDCAIAIGTRLKGKHVGLWGDSGCFSFYPVKQITTGEGGMFITRNPELAEKVRKARAFGVDRSFAERTIPGMYDVLSLGLNYRMSDINAALGRVQVRRYGEFSAPRKRNFARLKAAFSRIEGVRVLDAAGPDAENSHYCLTAALEGKLRPRRDALVMKLKEAGVGTSVYYPQPVPRMTYYKQKYGYRPEDFPGAEAIADGSIAFPVGPHLKDEDLAYIEEQFARVAREESK